MDKLEEHRVLLKEVIDGISSILSLDCAIFDTRANLVASTEAYLRKKGTSVHAPSIEEVILNGNILVNKPGYMKSCYGCRFKNQCPATIELLNCISIDEIPKGVIAITSFTKIGHDRMMKNINTYTKILNNFTDMVANIISYKDNISKASILSKTLQSTLDFSEDGMIIVDSSGYVSYCNPSSIKIFSTCSLYTLTLQQIIPDHINSKIMMGEKFHNKLIRVNNEPLYLSSYPIIHKKDFVGSIIRLSGAKLARSKKQSINTRSAGFSLNGIKGKSPSILDIKSKVKKIVNSNSTILITGETGTGKSLLAKAIHYESSRANNPFITVNCACIPQALLESELFGYEEGAFTGAKKGGKPGWFELAQNGTLFLDEIGEMPMSMQTKLLEVLQERTIERVGGINTIPIDVRVIAATNNDIEKLIKENKFRQDLYYRINVIPIYFPPLRERGSDIELLAYEFLKKYNSILNKNVTDFSKDLIEFFLDYNWPGNIRELENIIEYALNMTDETIDFQSIPEKYFKIANRGVKSARSKIEDMEYEIIKATLDKHGWDVKGKTAAAKELDMGLRTLYRKLKFYENHIAN